ncbi:PTS sugar transporter subunit IIB [Mucilaginibacter celer]|uniref:PTS mannose/fructose/sorbose transporter subunit IIB n=1 Tax=Mucilaginibacter celer TaxID=2305508 RepID=A0A494VWS3_9SPHI|nr:PTS sugar transporter subunit IIB [Mucilaginibacter celer]AYL95695.1 PTS mannose/fructose/sorbose transporter subunit IIB [Mucilaginibacter celer]
MIKLIRIDDRLVHGQVAFTWTPALGADCLLIANDKVAKDEFMKMTLSLAKPAGTKLLIKTVKDAATFLNDEKSKNAKVLVLINNIKDAAALAADVPEITSVNFGGLRSKEGSKLISKAIAVNDDDIAVIREMLAKGIELEVRQVPTDNRQLVESLI